MRVFEFKFTFLCFISLFFPAQPSSKALPEQDICGRIPILQLVAAVEEDLVSIGSTLSAFFFNEVCKSVIYKMAENSFVRL